MADLDELIRQAQAAIRNMDPKTKRDLQKRLAENQHLLDDPQGMKKMIDRLNPVTLRRLESRLGVKVSKSDLKSLDGATLQRLARRLRSELGR